MSQQTVSLQVLTTFTLLGFAVASQAVGQAREGVFVPLTPCRVVDTRSPFVTPGGILEPGDAR